MSEIADAAVKRGWRCEYDDTSGLQFPYTWFRPDGKVHDSYEILGDLPLVDIAKFTDRERTARRLQLKEGREHLTVTNEFQSDKYPWCPVGFVPIKVTDPLAMDLLSEYADRRRVIDAEFTRDLNDALLAVDDPGRDGQKFVQSGQALDEDRQ